MRRDVALVLALALLGAAAGANGSCELRHLGLPGSPNRVVARAWAQAHGHVVEGCPSQRKPRARRAPLTAAPCPACAVADLPSWYDCDEDNCKPPFCHCASTDPPGGLDPSDTPQFVLITVSGGARGWAAVGAARLLPQLAGRQAR